MFVLQFLLLAYFHYLWKNPSRFSIDGDGWITKCFHLTFKYFPAFLKKTFRKCLTFLWKPWSEINFGELQLWERFFGTKIQNEWRTAIFFVIAVRQVTIWFFPLGGVVIALLNCTLLQSWDIWIFAPKSNNCNRGLRSRKKHFQFSVLLYLTKLNLSDKKYIF